MRTKDNQGNRCACSRSCQQEPQYSQALPGASDREQDNDEGNQHSQRIQHAGSASCANFLKSPEF